MASLVINEGQEMDLILKRAQINRLVNLLGEDLFFFFKRYEFMVVIWYIPHG